MQLKEAREQNPATTIIYTKTACPKCDILKRRLNSLNIKYVEINLEEHPDLVEEIKALGARSAPIVQTPKDKYLFGNIAEMENELVRELRTPEFNRLYTPQQQVNLDARFPLVSYHYSLSNGYGEQIGAVLFDEDRGGVYTAESVSNRVQLTYSEHIISSRKAEHHADVPVSFPNEEVKEKVEVFFSAFVEKEIKNNLDYILFNDDLPVLETPREIQVGSYGWMPAQPLPLELQNVFNQPDDINFAAYYCFVDFEKALEVPELAELIKTNLFITENEFDALRGLPIPKGVEPTATQSAAVAQVHKKTLTSAHPAPNSHTPVVTPPQPVEPHKQQLHY